MGFPAFYTQTVWCSEALSSLTELVSGGEGIWTQMSYFKTQVSSLWLHFASPHPLWEGASIFSWAIPHAPQAHRAASTEDIAGPDPHLEREFWKRYSKKRFKQKDCQIKYSAFQRGSLRSFTFTQMCKILVAFKASVTLLYVHTSTWPWSSSKLSRNQLLTLNDIIKLASPPQLGYFECKLLACGSR